jgi:hypothetical protein
MKLRLSIVALLLVLFLFLVLVGGGSGAAEAQGMNAQCSITEVHATNEKGGIDAKLERLKAQLTQPPYSSWNTYKLLSEQTVTLERQKPKTAKLVNGELTLLYKDKLIEEGAKARVRIAVDHDDKSGKRSLSTVLVFGGPTSIGGKPYEGGTHFLFLACSAQ